MTPLSRVLVLLTVAVSTAIPADEGKQYQWFTAGKPSGSHVLHIHADGTRVSDWSFNDRGRGPSLHEEISLDQAGLIQSLTVSGRSYMGAVVDERFQNEGDKVSWRSTIEQGESQQHEEAFYYASHGTPENLAVLARALMSAEDKTLSLLPEGEAKLSLLTETVVAHEDKQQHVRLFAVEGLDLEPQTLWLDDAGELFALTRGWMGMAPNAWGDVLAELQALEDKADQARHQSVASELTNALPAVYAIRNVRVLDVVSGELGGLQTIMVKDGLVSAVGLTEPGAAVELVLDGQGGVLMPGLWDMHTHLSMGDGLLHMAAGVTTVRDLGNDPDRLSSIRSQFDSGAVIGPRSYAAGFIDRKSPYSAPIRTLAETREDALELVREYAAAGYPQIKIYSSIDPAWVKAIGRETHANGMRLSGHIPSSMTASEAVRQGFDEIQHINMLFLNFLAGPQDDTRTPLRFSLVAEQAGGLDLESAPVTEFIALLKAEDVVVDPTVAIFDSMFRHRSGDVDPAYVAIANHMPPAVRRGMRAADFEVNDDNADTYARSADALLRLIHKLHQSGIRLVAGTDAMPGFGLHRELELYQQAGIPAAEVLRLATIGSASVMGADTRNGSIEVGKQADMVLLTGNPLDNISAVRTPRLVFRGDRYFEPSRLYDAVGIRPFVRSVMADDAAAGQDSSQ
jgi:imidazolonepropionase-like amidohydrolase